MEHGEISNELAPLIVFDAALVLKRAERPSRSFLGRLLRKKETGLEIDLSGFQTIAWAHGTMNVWLLCRRNEASEYKHALNEQRVPHQALIVIENAEELRFLMQLHRPAYCFSNLAGGVVVAGVTPFETTLDVARYFASL